MHDYALKNTSKEYLIEDFDFCKTDQIVILTKFNPKIESVRLY